MASKPPTRMTLTTVLDSGGINTLRFQGMVATEALGQPFEFAIEALSDSGAIQARALLGLPASVLLESGSVKRHFHGLVCAMGVVGAVDKVFGYHLILRPWLWLLTRRTDTRVFQGLTVVEILKIVFEPFSPDCDFQQLTGEFPKYDYCVQYRETDFNFVSRLMEQEGIYYYFKHSGQKHTMVFVNGPSAHLPSPFQAEFDFHQAGRQDAGDGITAWRADEEIQPGKVVLRDYDYLKPKENLEKAVKAERIGAKPLLEVYDFPGLYANAADGARYSKLRMEELQARVTLVQGSGAVSGLACGHLFTLNKHPRGDQNVKHLVVSTTMELRLSGYESGQGDTSVHCQFTAIRDNETFRPQRITPKPVVGGLHTAIVVGKDGEEIYTDKHGRIKVKFHWEREGAGKGQTDDKLNSCWVRVSSPWAGKSWGAISLPRVGQEVVVDFLEGDPDRPLIVGSVFNGDQTPPYKLPDHKTVSTNKSRSSVSGDTATYNELRFEDEKGKEHIWLQAQRNFFQNVKNDTIISVAGDQDSYIGKDFKQKIDGGFYAEIEKAYRLDLKGAMETEVKESIFQKSGKGFSIEAADDFSVITEKGAVYIKAGTKVVIESAVGITLSAGGSEVVLGPAGVTIKGALVNINTGSAKESGKKAKKEKLQEARKKENQSGKIKTVGNPQEALNYSDSKTSG